MTDQLLTSTELAEALKISRNHVNLLANAGRIPFVDVSLGRANQRRYRLADVLEALTREARAS